jgi:cytochrome c
LTTLDEPALHLAIIYKHPDVADLLRERGVKAPPAEEVETLIASADLESGSKVASACGACHSLEREPRPGRGPPLWDIVGRPKASYADYKFSDALKATTGNWTYAELNDYIAHPAWTIPGITMKMPGIHDRKKRADLIAFLRTLSDHPAPLP